MKAAKALRDWTAERVHKGEPTGISLNNIEDMIRTRLKKFFARSPNDIAGEPDNAAKEPERSPRSERGWELL